MRTALFFAVISFKNATTYIKLITNLAFHLMKMFYTMGAYCKDTFLPIGLAGQYLLIVQN